MLFTPYGRWRAEQWDIRPRRYLCVEDLCLVLLLLLDLKVRGCRREIPKAPNRPSRSDIPRIFATPWTGTLKFGIASNPKSIRDPALEPHEMRREPVDRRASATRKRSFPRGQATRIGTNSPEPSQKNTLTQKKGKAFYLRTSTVIQSHPTRNEDTQSNKQYITPATMILRDHAGDPLRSRTLAPRKP
jgi:hypothetical protein